MDPDLTALAKTRADATAEPYMLWLDALSEGRSLQQEARLGESGFQQLAEACATPKQFAMLLEALDEHGKEHPEGQGGFTALAEEVNDSPYSLEDWAAAIEYFYDWLEQNGRHASFAVILPYLSCSVEAVASVAERPALIAVLTDMLDEYGFDG
ncbi:MAG: hypothetical protein AAGF10_03980 [Verrucomicrobiota bacterium]